MASYQQCEPSATNLIKLVSVLKRLPNASPKKIAQTDAIFSHVHTANRIADETEGVIRISIDTKATVNVGPFSRAGYSRQRAPRCFMWVGQNLAYRR